MTIGEDIRMGRKPLSSYPPEVAAQMRADISEKNRQAWAAGKFTDRQNGALRADTQAAIAATIKARWVEGAYVDRVNGMSTAYGHLNPGWKWGENSYRDIMKARGPLTCLDCGTDHEVDIHHFDEDHENYLLSNLGSFCVPCHLYRWHYDTGRKQPFVTISKQFPFEYAHVLPWHPGKCGRLHGHSGVLTVALRGRLDPMGVVQDYYDVGALVKMAVTERLDHQLLNDVITNPTSEAFLIWAWHELEDAGLKMLHALTFSETTNTTATLTKDDMVEAFGWTHDGSGNWELIAKPQ